MISDNKKEAFIDLQCLAEVSHSYDQRTVISFQHNDVTVNEQMLMHLMRKAVRKTGFKITRIEKRYGSDGVNLVQIGFYTNIPEYIWNESTRLYNSWIDEVGLN